MPLSIRSWKHCVSHWTVLTTFLFLSSVESPALSTGIPGTFNIDPVTVRQKEKSETPVLATVILKAPSPSFFVCQIRSTDRNKVSFANIVFKKGQLQGTAQGTVHWQSILKDCEVRISAFSIDAPEEKLWSAVVLKTGNLNPLENDENP